MKECVFVLLAFAPLMAKDSCMECHSQLDGRLQAPAAAFAKDIHAKHGLACSDCHGGDATHDEPDAAMSRAKGFVGKVARKDIPKFCAKCHSDAAYMRRFSPEQRVDQYTQYLTSMHGKRLAAGDEGVATCIDCHSVHDIRAVKDGASPVHPLRLPETCARCHADAVKMAKYKIPTTQFADYRKSVHWEALAKRGDLSAPSCASCHGNHGAVPPQVASVSQVCGTCHAMFEELYRKSPHRAVLADMGGCVVCHGNHAVHKPSLAMLAGSQAVCAQCHDAGTTGANTAAEMFKLLTGLSSSLDRSDAILEQAQGSGMEVSEAQMRQIEAREELVKARVAVHAFQLAPVKASVDKGLAISAETHHAGQAALKERNFRRIGLGIALLTILITIIGLWLAIRFLESPSQGTPELTGK
jgi:predicted CXXCH cytochrome family protein